MGKTGLVMEGGSMRGIFTAGALDVLMENDITFDGAVGVSAGACFGCNIKSKQIGRAIRYNKKYCKNWRYMSIRSWILTGNAFGKEFAYYKLPFELDVWDEKTYRENPMDFYAVATDMKTGEAVYQLINEGGVEDIEWIRASSSLPVMSKPVIINGRYLSDGGTSDSIPLKFMQEKGYEKNFVILTQPRDYVKHLNKPFWLFKIALRKYPALIEALKRRPDMYNGETAYIKKQEELGNTFVIAPPAKLDISPMEKNPDKMEAVYQLGRKVMTERLEELKTFLEK